MRVDSQRWFSVGNVHDVPSPGLLVYPERIQENVRRMIAIVGAIERLRPHVKTHKLPEIVRLQMEQGITRFKTATVAESEMVASCGAPDVLLAYQPVGPNVLRLVELAKRFPKTHFSVMADDAEVLRAMSKAFADVRLVLDVFLDIDCGMHRTGIAPGQAAASLYELISILPGLNPAGLHAYDGHLHDSDLAERRRRCEEAFAPVHALRTSLAAAGYCVPRIVAGGTPTFPIHALRGDVECSPGTCVLWDAGYGAKLPDLDFQPAAVVLTRVVSKPGRDRLCLDLGHKAIASESPPPRVRLLGLPEAKQVMHSEEHLVIETAEAGRYSVGDCLYGIPWHICPTVALHSDVVVVTDGQAQARWRVVARERSLGV